MKAFQGNNIFIISNNIFFLYFIVCTLIFCIDFVSKNLILFWEIFCFKNEKQLNRIGD